MRTAFQQAGFELDLGFKIDECLEELNLVLLARINHASSEAWRSLRDFLVSAKQGKNLLDRLETNLSFNEPIGKVVYNCFCYRLCKKNFPRTVDGIENIYIDSLIEAINDITKNPLSFQPLTINLIMSDESCRVRCLKNFLEALSQLTLFDVANILRAI
jgi:hypothetical protein